MRPRTHTLIRAAIIVGVPIMLVAYWVGAFGYSSRRPVSHTPGSPYLSGESLDSNPVLLIQVRDKPLRSIWNRPVLSISDTKEIRALQAELSKYSIRDYSFYPDAPNNSHHYKEIGFATFLGDETESISVIRQSADRFYEFLTLDPNGLSATVSYFYDESGKLRQLLKLAD
jgi:hypothetical protein|uniref:hypothetical protein n=1 Tax=Prosthecobacter sp. TaxID=1965333 RepID=UPI00378392D4